MSVVKTDSPRTPQVERWKYHKGYIIQTLRGDYIGALVRQGRNWQAFYGTTEDRMPFLFSTLDHGTSELVKKYDRDALEAHKASLTLYDYEVVVLNDKESVAKYSDMDKAEAEAAFRREVWTLLDNDYDTDMRVELLATAERSSYEEWVTLAEFTKYIVPEEGK